MNMTTRLFNGLAVIALFLSACAGATAVPTAAVAIQSPQPTSISTQESLVKATPTLLPDEPPPRLSLAALFAIHAWPRVKPLGL